MIEALFKTAVCAVLVALAPVAAVAQTRPADSRAIDQYVAAQVRDAHMPGLSLGVVNADGTVHVHGFGQAGPAGQAVTEHTPFIIGSMSKSFTALAVMQLVEQGELELDAPVQRYVPWFRVADAGASGRITLRHLLNQTSGIPTSAVKELQAGDGAESIEESVRRLSGVQLSAPVGMAFKYSNMNYVTLGLVIETVSGEPYGAYIQRHIFEPLDMRESFVSQTAASQAGLATPYRWLFGVPVPGELPYEQSLLPAGFLISSADDMVHYLTAQLDAGSFSGATILSPAGVAELHRAAAPVYPGADYAMGWMTSQIADHPAVWHNGVTAGFDGDMLLLPDAHVGVVVLSNVYGFGLEDYVDSTPQTIAEGVAGLLVNDTQSVPSEFLSTAYLIFDATAALALALVVVSLAQLVRSRSRPTAHSARSVLRRVLPPLLWEFCLPVGLLWLILQPLLGPLPVLLLYAPDLTIWLLTVALLLLTTGTTRVALALTAHARYPLSSERSEWYEPLNV